MPKTICLALLAVLSLVSVSFAEEGGATESYIYKKTEQADLTLKAYFPPDWKPEDQRPAIVFFFGGGWNSGTPTQFDPQSKYLAGRGMVAFCADYRVKSRHEVSPFECVEDAKSAVRWIRSNAEMLGVDPEKIVGSGGSAGGHIAACTGICPGLDHPDEDNSVSSVPNLLLLYNPVLNFNSSRLTARLGSKADQASTISPTRHLKKETPATLLFFGSDDALLPQAEEFLAKSKEIGHSAEMYLAEGQGHGFFNRGQWQTKTTRRADEFLVSQGYLAPEKK